MSRRPTHPVLFVIALGLLPAFALGQEERTEFEEALAQGVNATLNDAVALVWAVVDAVTYDHSMEEVTTVVHFTAQQWLGRESGPLEFVLRLPGGLTQSGRWLQVGSTPVFYPGEEYFLFLRARDSSDPFPFVRGPMGVVRVIRDSVGEYFLADAQDRLLVELGQDYARVAYLSGFEPSRPLHIEHSESIAVENPFSGSRLGLLPVSDALEVFDEAARRHALDPSLAAIELTD